MSWWNNPARYRALTTWTAGLLGEKRRQVRLDDDLPHPGLANEARIVLNPSWCKGGHEHYCRLARDLDLPPLNWEQFTWAATKGVAAHEVGHTRFSGPYPREPHLRTMVNALDDERVERGMVALWPRLHAYISLAKLAAWLEMPQASTASEAVLAWRLEHDLPPGLTSMIVLEGEEREKWARARPLVEQAWRASTHRELLALAKAILEIVGTPKPRESDWQGRPKGEKPESLPQQQEEASGQDSPDPSPQGQEGGAEETPSSWRLGLEELRAELEKVAQEVPQLQVSRPLGQEHGGHQRSAGGASELERQRPDRLLAQARPLANRLVAALRLPPREDGWTRAQMGERFSLRDHLRTPRTPFLVSQDPNQAALSLEVWCDSSGSMGFDNPKINDARLGVMALMLACEGLGVPTALAFFHGYGGPQWEVVKEPWEPFGPESQEYVAGWRGLGDEYLLSLMLARQPGLLAARRQGLVPVVMVVHDGYPVHDRQEIKAWLRRAKRQGLVVIGVYLGDAQDEAEQMRDLFPDVIVGKPQALPQQLALLLRRLVRR